MLEIFTRKHPVRAALSSLLMLVLVSCGGSSSDDEAPVAGTCESSQATVASATFNELWTNVFSKQCTGCHGVNATGTAGGPNMLTADAFYTGLVGKKADDYPNWDTYLDNRPGCVNFQFIQSGNANQSVITAILDSSVALTGCTVKYHRNEAPQNICITDPNLAKLKEWINAGAAR